MGLCPLHADRRPSFLVDPRQSLVLLLWLPARRRCDSFRRNLSRCAVRRSYHTPSPLVGAGLVTERGDPVLPGPASSSSGSRGRPGATRRAAAGVSRADADRLRPRPLPARLVDELGLRPPRLTTSRRRHAQASTPWLTASSSPSKPTSTGAASAQPIRIDFCPAAKAVCMAGQAFVTTARSCWWRACSIGPRFGQAGFRNIGCSLGACLNATQLRQLCDGATRTVYLAFDSDANGSGQRAGHPLARRLWAHRVQAFPVELPAGHDPNSFFVSGGGDAHQFQVLLERARS